MVSDIVIVLYIAALNVLTASAAPQNKIISHFIPYNQSLQQTDDLYLEFTQLTEKYGYPIEQHTVITEDGYVLTLYRILSKCSYTIGYPVLLVHGIFDSSDSWLVAGPSEGIGYKLPDNCYDVWAINFRGNTYSRKHVTLNPDKDLKYWDYSFEENAVNDLTATIDYILEVTKRNKVYYIGNSQGTTTFFIMASLKPEYNSKIHLSIQLAPVVWMTDVGTIYKLAASRSEVLAKLAKKLGINEILAKRQLLHAITVFACQASSDLCASFMNIIYGEKIGNLSPKRMTNGLGHLFAGASFKALNHYAQFVKYKKFQRFDEGEQGNLRRYGVGRPPEYNVSLVTSPVVLLCGQSDLLSSIKDVQILTSKIPNLIEAYVIPDPSWSHTDFLFNENAVKYVVSKILTYFSIYNNL